MGADPFVDHLPRGGVEECKRLAPLPVCDGDGDGDGSGVNREDAKVFGIWGTTNLANVTMRYFVCPFEC